MEKTLKTKKLNFLQRFAHNKLDWGYPTIKYYDDFQGYSICECGVKLCQDSTGAWFHLGRAVELTR